MLQTSSSVTEYLKKKLGEACLGKDLENRFQYPLSSAFFKLAVKY